MNVAIIVDPYGCLDRTGEEEIEWHKKELQKVFKGLSLTFQTPRYFPEQLKADLVIFDFGGMSLGNDLLASNSRRLAQWLLDHPSSLVYVASTFTYHHGLRYELEDLGIKSTYDPWEENSKPPLPNLLVGSYSDLSGYEHEAKMKGWFDVSHKKSIAGDYQFIDHVFRTESPIRSTNAKVSRSNRIRRRRGSGTRRKKTSRK